MMKVKGRGNWTSAVGRKLGLPAVFFLCFFFFILGFFASSLVSQDFTNARLRARLLESTNGEEDIAGGGGFGFDLLPSGDTGDDSISSIPFQVLSWRPRVLYFPMFATAEQCETIVSIARSQLQPSRLALRKGETADSTREVRTRRIMSCGMKLVRNIILIMTHSIQRNMVPRKVKGTLQIASFLLYLTDVEEGGETMFPYENDNIDLNYDYKQCIGLKIKPRKGDGLLFYSVFTNGTIDPTSLHGSCPVIKGEKWVATKWLRDQEEE
ncbi:hypothetical protein RND81_13G192300 [Saponaria officinalis]|uniref:Fe2OG dioxygenase domain-containing protein n=1 Tax=Saponaria officinalis TaxID=3572 RepID=A0AAW1H1P5_SAPOF